jgi:hypothetical protein
LADITRFKGLEVRWATLPAKSTSHTPKMGITVRSGGLAGANVWVRHLTVKTKLHWIIALW